MTHLAGSGGVSPVAWIAAMGSLGARLDAYAHHPYPGRPQTKRLGPACDRCASLTMADLERLVEIVHRNLGRKRIWLTSSPSNEPARSSSASRR
jgi:hypothetical protein